jgi:hypothetical protein
MKSSMAWVNVQEFKKTSQWPNPQIHPMTIELLTCARYDAFVATMDRRVPGKAHPKRRTTVTLL